MNLYIMCTTVFSFLDAFSRADQRDPLWKRVELVAVTHFDGIEAYYKSAFEKVKFRQAGKEPKQPDKSTIKSLCKNIFKNAFFKMNQEDWANTNGRGVRAALKNDHQDVFETMYRKLERQATSIRLRPGEKYKYVNAYKRRKIFVDNNEEFEYTFTCLVKNRESNRLKAYFVSPTYNVNLVRASQPAIAGRFIFAYDKQGRLLLRAMAEEPAKPNVSDPCPKKREESYIAIKKPFNEVGHNDMTSSLEEDPVCQLAPSEKLRLCTTAMTSYKLRKKVIFHPQMNNVQIDCETRRISFRDRTWRKIEDENTFEERMIACKPFDKNGRQLVYYVSRGYDINRIFVYEFRDNKVFIENSMSRASVVRR